ncbi:hypothetical protein EV175_002160 [Coemansia sp. RSA 1933]|nr:hypothetical protein EV175_002160 [Coemansia sp. RSA 1933]
MNTRRTRRTPVDQDGSDEDTITDRVRRRGRRQQDSHSSDRPSTNRPRNNRRNSGSRRNNRPSNSTRPSNHRRSVSPPQLPRVQPQLTRASENDGNGSFSSELSIDFCPSGSPTKVTGTRMAVNAEFADVSDPDACRVDKSLICRGFWDAVRKAGRICLPRRSGKTYNLTQLLLFYSSLPEEDYLQYVPDSALATGGGTSIEDIQGMDVETKCRRKREYLFEGSLLQTMHPHFYREHFMKYPVLHISFSECRGATLDIFLISICSAITLATGKWLSRCRNRPGEIPIDVQITMDTLQRYLGQFAESRVLISSGQVNYPSLVLALIDGLSYLISELFGRYILLIDEYDIPFITISLASWSMEEKQIAQSLARSLFQKMLKDNRHLLRGLLFGVFEIPLTEMGSGANNVEDICAVPCEESVIQGNILSATTPHSGNGLDALADSFWFNTEELGKMLDNVARIFPLVVDQKAVILDTMREWYDGYYIGRFSGKYNPWSVSAFIANLYGILSRPAGSTSDLERAIRTSARSHWVSTGTTTPIERQIDSHGSQFAHLAKRLLTNFEATRMGNQPQRAPICRLDSALVDMAGANSEQFTEPKVLMMCLYAGYLTRHTPSTVRIPNREVYREWVRLYARSVLGPENAAMCLNYEQGRMLREFWRGRTDYLREVSLMPLSSLRNHNRFREREFADHVSGAIAVARYYGALTPPSQATVDLAQAPIVREPEVGTGKSDIVMRLYSTNNVPNHLGVIIECKWIPDKDRDNEAAHRALAKNALSQIVRNRYYACLDGCLERLDIGLAICDMVAEIEVRRYKRTAGTGAWRRVESFYENRS